MASHRPHSVHASAAPSRVSLADSLDARSSHTTTGRTTPAVLSPDSSRYSISAVLHEPAASSSLLPALPALPSASSYLPTQLSSLSTTFTSAGTLPRSAAPGAKSVAQRRSQAPPIQVTELRKVARAEFEPYLRELSDDYDRWQKESRLGRDGVAEQDAATEQGADALRGLGIAAEGRASSSAGRAPASAGKAEEVLPSLDDVPQIFFDASFDLANPRTFDLVTERIQLSPHSSPSLAHSSSFSALNDADNAAPRSTSALDVVSGLGPHTLNDLAADQVLQEKLSHYTAVIESHLVREIGLRSSSFFAALSNLQSLHSEGENALAKISELQAALAAKEGGVGSTAQHGLQVLRAQARRRGLERIEESVRAVEEVWTAVEGVKELVENGEWDGALEVGEQIEEAYLGSADASAGSSSSTAASNSALSALSGASPTKPSSRRATPASRPLNLTKIRALSSLPSKLALLRAQIAKSLEGELISVLEHEMDVSLEEHVRLAREGRRWKGKERADDAGAGALAATGVAVGSPRVLQDVREEEDEDASAAAVDEKGDESAATAEPAAERLARERTLERVRPVVRALVRAEGMDSAVAAWRESVLREVRAVVREHLPTAETPTAEEEDQFAQAAVRAVSRASVDLGSISEKSLSLAKKIRSLSHEAFLELARETYRGLLACIEVVDLQARVLLELWAASRQEEQQRKARRRRTAPAAVDDARPSTSGSTLAVPGSAAELVAAATSTMPDSSRSSTSADDASTLSTEISDVVHAVAELANVRFSKVIGVRTEIHAHLALADFVAVFDLSWQFVVACELVCKRMIVGLRGAMVAQAKSFLQAFHQKQITDNARVVEEEQWAAAEVPPETQRNVALIVESATGDPFDLLLGERRTARLAEDPAAADKANGELAPAKQVDIEGRQFFAVSAGLITIAVLVEYLKVLCNSPMLTTDAMSKIIEFMKVFNSRTCQVVLGAGAMRSAGLKNITAKHLALASQALSIMIALIPYIREAVRRHLNPKQTVMLTEFDKLKRDYQEHQHEIHAKLVAIMSDRLQVHSRTLEGLNFEEPAPKEGSPNAYMESLVKEHITLHKVLSRFLQTETVESIMTQVFTALDARLTEVFAGFELKSQQAKDRMLVDVRYLRDKLGDLKSLEDKGPGRELEALVESKPLPKPAAKLAPAPAARPGVPPRSSSIPPPSSSPFNSPALATPAIALETPAATPPPAQPVFSSTSASASTTSLAAPDPTTAPASPVPRPSFDAGVSAALTPAPPSPSSSPAPLPASPPKPAPGPAPYVSKKKKTLAERLAESMGRKAAPPPAADAPAPAPATVATAPSSAAVDGSATSANGSADRPPSPAAEVRAAPADEIVAPALEANGETDTPALEKELQLEGVAVPALETAAKEELEEVAKAVEAEIAAAPNGDEAVDDGAPANDAPTADREPAAAAPGAERGNEEAADQAAPAVEPSVAVSKVDLPGDSQLVEEVDTQPIATQPIEKADTQAAEAAQASSVPEAAAKEATEPAESQAVDFAATDELESAATVEPAAIVEPAANVDPAASVEIAADLTPPVPPVEAATNGIATVEAPAVGAVVGDTAALEAEVDKVEPAGPAIEAAHDEPRAGGPTAAAEAPAPALSPAPPAALEAPDSASAAPSDVAPPANSAAPAPADSTAPVPEASPSTDAAPPTAPVPASPPPAPAAPPRKKSLKERLAEAARRGSTGGSVSRASSEEPLSPAKSPPPLSTVAALAPAVPVMVEGANGAQANGAVKSDVVVASPEAAAAELPALAERVEAGNDEAAEAPVVQEGAQPAAKQEEAKVDEGSMVDEEESSFL
ncbi:hypothetical protein Rhopal_001689-T1 [Rhodotorula paludigena]|uniref:Vacuolar protein sorting-associated protein 54 C-terminal domain-containing protein n=1 Tax=Rhodotorula paludigena TaxID=86838 RepID=A0AAV5GF32_9BASI|nr:hypothetical protein Rhopal_001689-T1 [Rhodotorula paludigena]